jgi:DNA modification methylase
MKIINFYVNDLVPYEKNPRKNDKAVKAVANSIKEFGFKVPIIVDKNNVIVAGHTRLKAAIKLGLEEVPCIIADDLTEDQIKAFRLADNKVGEIAEWDEAKLLIELQDIQMDMSQFEFDINLGKDVEDDDFEVELPDEPVSQRGDVYLLGKHRVMCGDATNAEDMKILCGSTLVDLSLTDPPYNVNIGLKGEAYEKREDSNRFKNRKLLNDNLSDAEFLKFLTDAFQNMHDYSKQGAAIYVFHADSEGYNFRKAFKDAGYDLKQTLIWMKNSLVLGRQDYQWMHEPILYGWKSGASHSWYGDRKQTTVLKYDRPLKSAEHPTMKPIELCGYLIKNSSKEGDVVLDPFGGSGSTMISCEQLNRTCYMMELDPKYVDVIIERYEKFTGQKAVKVNYEGGDLV